MKNVNHTRQSNEPLILNKDMKFSINFNFDGVEVDLLSALVSGKRQIITDDILKAYLQGVFERLVLETSTIENKREVAINAAIKSGMTEKQIKSYLRGWDQVGLTVEKDASEMLLEKASSRTLTAYQVGDNDVVAAYDKDGAIQILADYCGFDADEFYAEDYGFGTNSVSTVEDLTSKLNVMLKGEDGEDLETLGDWMNRVNEPEYLYGWE